MSNILRAKTIDLLKTKPLSDEQEANSNLNIEELNKKAVTLKSYPRRIVLELTNACNLRCIMCGRDEAKFKNTFFDLANLEKLKSLLNSTEEVTLFGWGEPTIHPQFINILKYLDNFPVRKYFVTNGTRLNLIIDALFNYHVDIMAVSLDGASSKVNDNIRKGGNFDKIVADLKNIVNEKKAKKLNYPYINFVLTAMKSNFKDIPDMVKLAHEIGLEEVKVVYLTVFSEHLINESLYNNQKEVEAVFNEAIDLAGKLGVKIKLPYIQGQDPAAGEYHKNCYVGWRDFFLGSDGFVRPCQSTAMKLFDFSKYESFEQMWNSDEYKNFRSCANDAKNMPEECKRCYQSSHANWNLKSSFIQVGSEFAPTWD